MPLDADYIRKQFPALELEVNNHKAAFFDAPGGTQVPKQVIEAMNDYLINCNANKQAAFETSRRTDQIIKESRQAMADFLGCSWQEIAFADNTTTNIYKLAAALGRDLNEGDEVIITELDHEANRGPWLALREKGIQVKEVKVNTESLTLEMEDFKNKLSERTKVVAFVYASNAVGTITPVKEMIDLAHEANALVVVDAVHYALHGPIDVKELDVDYLLCSVYKFFGPHLGVLYGKEEVFEMLNSYHLRPQSDEIPEKIETGTKNHEGIAGAKSTIDFIADIGANFGAAIEEDYKNCSKRRQNIIAGMKALEDYETPLANYLSEEIDLLDKVRLYRPDIETPRTSTVSFVIENINSHQVAEELNRKGLFVWSGDFYATRLVERLGLLDRGGLVRVGLAPYNTKEEIDRLIEAIQEIAS